MTEGESGQETQSENLPSADGHKGQGHIGPSQKNGSSSGWVSVWVPGTQVHGPALLSPKDVG